MQCCSKDKIECVSTENSPKATIPENVPAIPETKHICPSKLSRRELEDVYFALMRTNMDLKRIINNQTEKQKFLTTKLQRVMNTQKTYMGSETKECCSATKVLVHEQKTVIKELKRVNDNLKEQVKQLNMKLCTTKQFLRSSTVGGVSVQHQPLANKAPIFGAKRSPGKKNTSSNGANQSIADELKNTLMSVSCQSTLVNLPAKATRTIATITDLNGFSSKVCDENRCHTLMNELKQEIVVLHETLKTDHGKYSTDVSKLADEIDHLQSENAKMKNDGAVQNESLEKTISENQFIEQKLSEAQKQYDDLEAKLKIEKARVAELKTQLRANKIANDTISAVTTQIIVELPKQDKYKYLLDKKEAETNQTNKTPKYNRNTHESIKASALPKKLPNSVGSTTLPTKVKKSDDSLKSPLVKKGKRDFSISPQKVKEPINAPMNKQKSDSTSPIRTKKLNDPLKPNIIKRDKAVSPKPPPKKQGTANASTSMAKEQKNKDSSTSPIISKNTNDSLKPLFIKSKRTSPELPQKLQTKTNSSVSPVKNKKLVDSSQSPIKILENSYKSPFKKNKPTDNPSQLDDSYTSPKNIKKEDSHALPSNIKKAENIPTLSQEEQENVEPYRSPVEERKSVNTSPIPNIIKVLEDASANVKEISPLSEKVQETNDAFVAADETQKSIDSSTSPIKTDEIQDVENTTDLPYLILISPEATDTSAVTNVIQKTDDSTNSPTNTEGSDTSSMKLQKTVGTSVQPDETQTSVDSSTSPIRANKIEDSYTSPLNIKSDVISPRISIKSQESVEKEKPKLNDFPLSAIERNKTDDSPTNMQEIQPELESSMLAPRTMNYDENILNETKETKTLSQQTLTYSTSKESPKNKSKTTDKRYYEGQTADNEDPDQSEGSFKSCQCCECPPMKIVRKSTSKDKYYTDKMPEQNQSNTRDESNKPIDIVEIGTQSQNDNITPYNDELKDSKDNEEDMDYKDITEKNKYSNEENQYNSNGNYKAKEFIVNVTEETFPSRAVKSPYHEKAPSPQKLDDSGFADANKSVALNDNEQTATTVNTELLDMIATLQAQLDSLKQFLPLRSDDPSHEPKKTDDPLGTTNADTPDAIKCTDDIAPRKSLARLKYTAERNKKDQVNENDALNRNDLPNERDLQNRNKPEKKTHSVPLQERVALGKKRPSLTNQSQFIPSKQELFDADKYVNTPYSGSPKMSNASATKEPNFFRNMKIDSMDMIDKRVMLKLEPEHIQRVCFECDKENCCCDKKGHICDEDCNTNNQNKRLHECSNNRNQNPEPRTSGPTFKYSDPTTIKQPDESDDSPKNTKNSYALKRNFYLPPEDSSQENQSEKHPQNVGVAQSPQDIENLTDPARFRSTITDINAPWDKVHRHGTPRAPDSKGGQKVRTDSNYTENGLEMNQNPVDSSPSLKALSDLRDKYTNAKESPICNQNAKYCTVGVEKQGLVPNDCSCPIHPETGLCSCVQYMKTMAADASLRTQLPEHSIEAPLANLQGTSPIRRKIHAPLAITATPNVTSTMKGTTDAAKNTAVKPFNANLNDESDQNEVKPYASEELCDLDSVLNREVINSVGLSACEKTDDIQSSKASPSEVQPHTFDKINPNNVRNEERRTSTNAWPDEKQTDGSSIPSKYVQLKRPTEPTTVDTSPPTLLPNLEPVLFRMDKGIGELQICEKFVHICNCPKTARREVAIFRSCSGTLRFRTISSTDTKFRICSCQEKIETGLTKKDENTQSAENSDAIKNQETFSVEAPAYVKSTQGRPKKHSCISPENTDREISSMSDLPSEKTTTLSPKRDKRGDRNSPGQNKETVTAAGAGATSTATSPTSAATQISNTATPFSLSEGEVPLNADPQKDKLSPEKELKLANTQTPKIPASMQQEPVTAKVEQALAAISQELALCRQLMLKTHPQKDTRPQKLNDEDNSGLRSLSYNSKDSSISLHAVSGHPHLGGAQTPRVMFIMHIGSMVLSDEAVLNCRDLNLVLTWKFYDQNVAMSHLRPGRVVHFDFSTEYDLKLTDHFLNYLKSEELTIYVCEANKLNTPLAYCNLPLREALLHTNRRADVSLALINGPHSRSDTVETRDEMGVIDLWCMLRADVHYLPYINNTIASSRFATDNSRPTNGSNKQAVKSRVQSNPGPIMSQINDDDQDEVRMSEDLQSLSPVQRLPKRDMPSFSQLDRGQDNTSINTVKNDRMRFDNYQTYGNAGGKLNTVDPLFTMNRPSGRHGSLDWREPKNSYTMESGEPRRKPSGNVTIGDTRQKASGLLINDVPPNIRTVSEFKHAIENRFIPNSQNHRPSLKAERLNEPGKQNSLDEILNKAFDRNKEIQNQPPQLTNDRLGSHLSFSSHKTDSVGNSNRRASYSTELTHKYETVSQILGAKRNNDTKRADVQNELPEYLNPYNLETNTSDPLEHLRNQSLDITVLWLALNEECKAMNDPNVQRLYVAYTFLDRGGAALETPLSLPKPRHYLDKCFFNFKKNFQLTDPEFMALGRLAQIRTSTRSSKKCTASECAVFTIVSEPIEDPLGLNNCEDIGTACLYFGDLLAYSAGSNTYTDVIPVRSVETGDVILGVLAVRVDGLDLVRQSLKQVELSNY